MKTSISASTLHLSASKVSTFKTCKRKYKYIYLDKIKSDEELFDFLELGKFVHRAIELFNNEHLKKPIITPKRKEMMQKCISSALKESNKELLKPRFSEACDMLNGYLSAYEQDYIIHNEFKFSIPINDFIFKGVIDCIRRISENEIEIIDYKTNKTSASISWFQLVLYGIVMKRHFNVENVKLTYHFLVDGKKREKYLTQEMEDKALEVLLTAKDMIMAETEFEARPSRLCEFCSFRQICEEERANRSWL